MADYCYGCMRAVHPEEEVCPVCGYRHGQESRTPFALPCGAQLHAGRYLIGRVLGQGGFGITYVGLDLALELKVAVKEYYPTGSASRSATSSALDWFSTAAERDAGRESFVREARKMAKTHKIPNVVDVRDVFFENGTAYIVMDFLEGETLRDRLQKTGTLSRSACLAVLRPVMDALEQAHQRGLIHRDVSPDNIMMDEDGTVWLLDLGAAKEIEVGSEGVTHSTTPVVKRGFSPPEQSSSIGKIGPWTDVYAMCATIYYCITGKLTPDAMDRMLGAKLEYPDSIPPDLAEVLDRGLALKPEERIQSMEALRLALGDVPADPPSAEAREKESRRSAGSMGITSALKGLVQAFTPGSGKAGKRPEPASGVGPASGTPQSSRPEELSATMPSQRSAGRAAPPAHSGGASVLEELSATMPSQRFAARQGASSVPAPVPVSPEGGLTYVAEEDHAEITGYRGAETAIVLPPVLEGKPVTAVRTPGEGAGGIFSGFSKNLTAVVLPAGVVYVGRYAFSGCSALARVALPEGLTSIGKSAFNGCRELHELTLPEGLRHIGAYAFRGCSALTELVLPETLRSLGFCAFRDCGSLTALRIPGGIGAIKWGTLDGCGHLSRLALPAGLQFIGVRAFRGCEALAELRFGGTSAQWEAAAKEIGNEALARAVIRFQA